MSPAGHGKKATMSALSGDNYSSFSSNHRRAARLEASGFESVQNVIFESIRENGRLQQTEEQTNVFLESFRDIQVVANETIETLKKWNGIQRQTPHNGEPGDFPIDSNRRAPFQASDTFLPLAQDRPIETNMLTDLADALASWGVPSRSSERLHHRSNRSRDAMNHVQKVVTHAVQGDFNDAANSIWKFAGGGRDSDENTVATFDTMQDETNQIRRLGSWGTVNTCGSGGTNDTGFASCDTGQTPREINFVVADDDGNMIDPVLFQKAQKTREKRTSRRKKLVKFDYPPIKSLRQCPRPDPEDLPNLFFTEDELYQIEDDRYCTMSTDDIEIVAVSSNTEETEQSKSKFKTCKSPKATSESENTVFESSPVEHNLDSPREQPEPGFKKPRERASTPYRRRYEIDEEEADILAQGQKLVKSPSSSGRLVKGVQIFLRERSTGV